MSAQQEEKKQTQAPLQVKLLDDKNTLYVKILTRAHGSQQTLYATNKVLMIGTLSGRGRARKMTLQIVWKKADVTKEYIDWVMQQIQNCPH